MDLNDLPSPRHGDKVWVRNSQYWVAYKIARRSGKGSWRRACEAPGCIIEPTFRGPGETRMRCSKHRLEGDEQNAKGSLCIHPGCTSRAQYGPPPQGHSASSIRIVNRPDPTQAGMREKYKLRCAKHKQEGDISWQAMCAFCGELRATHGYLGVKEVLAAAIAGHLPPLQLTPDELVDLVRMPVKKSRAAQLRAVSDQIEIPPDFFAGYGSWEQMTASLGHVDGKLEYPSPQPNEVLLRAEEIPAAALLKFYLGSQLFCAKHGAERGALNVGSALCTHPGCTTRRSFGPPGGRLERCVKHARRGEVTANADRRAHPCLHDGCRKTALFGDPANGRRMFCAAHAEADMVDVSAGGRAISPLGAKHLLQLFDGGAEEGGGGSSTYTYVLVDHATREAVIIDPVLEQVERDCAALRELGLTPTLVLNTHVHADHITGSGVLKREFPGLRSAISAASGAEADILLGAEGGGGKPEAIRPLVWADGTREIEVLPTPGHTAGCVSFVDAGIGPAGAVFTGDALLIGGCGRTDFQEGDAQQLYKSVHGSLFSLPDDTLVFPAHDYNGNRFSSVGQERTFNARLTLPEEKFIELMGALDLARPAKMDTAVPANLRCGVF